MAQAECASWIHQLERARQGLPGAVTESTAAGELHSAVMLYWTQIRRFRDQDAIQSVWSDERVPGFDFTLSGLSKMRLQTTESRQRVWNPDTGSEEVHRTSKPWQMSPNMALAVHDQLDRCAHQLGFDAVTDTGGVEAGSSIEDLDAPMLNIDAKA